MEAIERKIMKQKTFRISESLNEKLSYLAEATGYSENEIITMALEEKIEDNRLYLSTLYIEHEITRILSWDSLDFIRESRFGRKVKIPAKVEKVFYNNDPAYFYPYYFSLEYIENKELSVLISYFDSEGRSLGSDTIKQKDFFKGDTPNLKKGADTYYRKLLKSLPGLAAFKEYMLECNEGFGSGEYFFWEDKTVADKEMEEVYKD